MPPAGLPAGLACPGCGGPLGAGQQALTCEGCERIFPVICGIADLRLAYPDPYVTLDEDRALARELEAHFDELDLAGLLRLHWRRSGKPAELAERFLAGDAAAIQRSEAYLAAIEEHRGAALHSRDRVLEVGAGTAALAAVARRRAGTVVASDISMRWLVLAKKRLAETGVQGVELVCCGAEELPFATGSFDLVVAGDVIEHASRQDDFAAGCRRVLDRGGTLFLATPNRFSLALEPHVRLWGVGLLPRGLARRYVETVRRAPYDHVRLLSARALRRLLAPPGFAVAIVPPEIPPATQAMYRGAELRLVRAYNRVRSVGPARRLLLAVGPFFHVFATVED